MEAGRVVVTGCRAGLEHSQLFLRLALVLGLRGLTPNLASFRVFEHDFPI